MTKRSAPVEVVSFIRGLRREHGGFAATPEGAANLRPTLSALKVLEHLGALSSEPRTADFIVAARHVSGGFGSAPGADPTPLDTAAGLISLHALGRSDLLEKLLPDALTYLAAASASQFDHFMQIATYQECQVAHPTPAGSIAFFQDRLGAAIAADKIIDLAIAGSALMRAGQALPIRDDVARRLLAGQGPVEGGFGEGEHASLFGTYCVMRHLALLNVPPDTRRLLAYIDSLRTDWGYADAPGGATSADATYQCLEILAWLGGLQRGAVEMARAGDRAGLLSWLENGGDPDLTDDEGWTPLLAAASHGRADAVDLLLNHNIPGVPRADPAKRFEPADALPLYMAGHAGDLRTVQLLLQAAPEHLHAISSVNGHTVLLQAAFYGKQRHLELAAWLLDNAAQIAGKPKADLVDEQVQLLSATNVRGYSALGMQDLWHNEQMKEVLLRYYPGGVDGERGRRIEAAREEYAANLLLSIATPQALTEKLMTEISAYLESDDPHEANRQIDAILAQPHFRINRLGGDLQMPPLVFALTGVDVGDPERARRRRALATKLLMAGADPTVREKHPMAVGAVIRASVLNNFNLLQLLAEWMTPEDFRSEMDTRPAVNGLTAMHDAIHRALTSPPAELESHVGQIAWMIEREASVDIPDNTGQTQRQLAEAAEGDAGFPPKNVRAVLDSVAGAGPRGTGADDGTHA